MYTILEGLPAPSKDELLILAQPYAKVQGTVLLFSGGDFETSRKSFLALFPTDEVVIHLNAGSDPWLQLEQTIKDAWWFGYLGYELLNWNTPRESLTLYDPGYPIAYFQKPSFILETDHVGNTARIYTTSFEGSCKSLIDSVRKKNYGSKHPAGTLKMSLKSPFMAFSEYESYVHTIQNNIRNGDVYQVNLSHRIACSGIYNPYDLFQTLLDLNPTSFASYIFTNDRVIMSFSPERFLRKTGKYIDTWPIKGTAPRSNATETDSKNLRYLLESEKEIAELLMITDLMRNDIGRVCRAGSVKVEKLREIAVLNNVYQAYSVVGGDVLDSISTVEILRSCFPGGSITGCPKGKAVALINSIEKRPRGIYTGSIGYIQPNGDFDFNIAIRTIDGNDQEIAFQLGGGITIDSCPEKEYLETLYKGAPFFNVLKISPASI